MSDEGLTLDTAPPSQPGSPAPAATPSPDSAPAAGIEDDPFSPAPDEQAVFSRGYVDRIRNEGARYRTELNSTKTQLGQYDNVFGVYPDEDREVWFQLARDWTTDPTKAAAVMRQIAEGVLGEGDQGLPADAPAAPDTPASAPTLEQAVESLTSVQVQQMIADALQAREADAANQQAVQSVYAEVRAAGYDPESADGFSVLYNANHFTNGDIPKAVEMVKARDQKVIDEYIAGRQGRPLVSPSQGSQATSAPAEIKTIDDARRATEAFLRERRSAS